MPLTVEQRLISRNFRRCTGRRKIEYIVIHYFGSLGTAAAVANYFNTPGIQASAHYCLDEGSTVYQCVEDNNIAWHCGTSGAYVHPRCRNENSIGIEVRPYKLDKSTARSAAPADWYFPPEIVDNLVVFTQMLMQKYNVPLENVVRHYDVDRGRISAIRGWATIRTPITARPAMNNGRNSRNGYRGELDMNIEEARKQLTSCADTGDTPSHGRATRRNSASERAFSTETARAIMGGAAHYARSRRADSLQRF